MFNRPAFNGPALTREVKELLFRGDLDAADALVARSLAVVPRGELNRMRQLQGLCTNVRESAARAPAKGHEPIALARDERPSVRLAELPGDVLGLAPGAYEVGKREVVPSSFAADFPNADATERARLRASRFDTAVEGGTADGFRVVEDAFLCGRDHMTHAYAYEGGLYANEESGRIAKSCRLNTRVPHDRTLPAALLLPIPHHAGNYYHVVAETAFGLRFASRVGGEVPVVVPEDRHGVLPRMCELVGLDPRRLLAFDKARRLLFRKAIIPGQPPYYWNRGVFGFFRGLVRDPPPSLRLYVSRRLSGRGPANEADVEAALSRRGFQVVHSERLAFAEQAELFSRAAAVASPHGAGLTNVAFTGPGTKLVELFPPHMLARNFYMRSRHNRMPYRGLLFDGSLPLDKLEKALTQQGF